MKKFTKIAAFLFFMSSSLVCAQKFMLKVSNDCENIVFKNYSSTEAVTGKISLMHKTKSGFSTPEIMGGFETGGFNTESQFDGKVKIKGNDYLVVETQKDFDGKLKVSLSYDNKMFKKNTCIVNIDDK